MVEPMQRFVFILAMCAAISSTRADTVMTVEATAQLIRAAEKSVVDSRGWAFDLLDVLQIHNLPQSRENVCAAIAVIDQESGFVADPAVVGLGKLSEAALRAKFSKIPLGGTMALRWLENNPTPDTSFMARIRKAKTERDLDLAYRSLVDYAGQTTSLDKILQLGFLNSLIEDRNEIDTAGSMQVSVKFALDMARKRRWLPMTLTDVYAVRDDLYTRHGGMYYGVKQLLDYESGYNQKIFRFADFNAGRYAARNAALQSVISVLSGVKLATDGDLLSYGKRGNALKSVTSSEKAIRKARDRYKLPLTDAEIRNDLLQEKQTAFVSTQTFEVLRKRYESVKKTKAPFARMPDIALNSPKLKRSFSTAQFADSVNRRYQFCMK
jgi:Protein of unknown function (DUF1615)